MSTDLPKGFAQNYDQKNLRTPVGYKDDGHVILKCSNCNACLVDIWLTNKDKPLKWRGRAKCPYCPGDEMSYIEEWKGLFAIDGVAADSNNRLIKPGKNAPEKGQKRTTILKVEEKENDNLLLFHVVREGNTPPVYE